MVETKLHRRIEILLPIFCVLIALFALMLHSAEASESARNGLSLCARVIIPSLLPFYVISALLTDLGLPRYLGRFTAPFMSRMFGVGGEGSAAFIIGISGGYPLGASVAADIYTRGECGKDEAERLIAFCNNSGPAFILGAAGIGIFKSSVVGIILYIVHVLAAVIVGMFMSGNADTGVARTNIQRYKPLSFSDAFAKSIKSAITSTLTVCGFVVFFSVVVGVLDALGIFSALTEIIAYYSGFSRLWVRSLLTGLLELGSGIGSMDGFAPTTFNLALAAFTLGWGGLSVHCQTLAVASGSGLSVRRHTIGKALHGVISAILVCGISMLIDFS